MKDLPSNGAPAELLPNRKPAQFSTTRLPRNQQPAALCSKDGSLHGAGFGVQGQLAVVTGGRTRILVDAGLSCRELC